ncbi:type VI secretion system baseplate subunit TssG [Paraburkholderia mimosarum]|uniref:type VI secretion system baseplate subunit TssG n=1 Tax=Paraburkholderia mimosarum TaxID=312026 RepID=UPI00040BC174|nr:type VI secretion system baseplate subunit TssG [Paraburkholderia mimosarum]
MAAETRATADAVKDLLLTNGETYSWFQAIRLLRLYDRHTGLRQEHLRVRPRLGLGFPENDIDRIEALPGGNHRITANFFGLYGVSSPLPTYYTEDLFEEQREGRHVTRDFLDIVHYALYPLLFDAWAKYRIEQRIVEDRDEKALNHLYAFVGLNDADLRVELLPASAELLRYAGLFNQRPRSALGLKTMLADTFAPARIRVECGLRRAQPIPADQRWQLGTQGSRLCDDAWLGELIDDYGGTIKVQFADVPQPLFHQLLLGGAAHERLHFLTRFYLIDPLDVDVELDLRREEAHAARCGRSIWSRLGYDTWLNPGLTDLPTRVRYRL